MTSTLIARQGNMRMTDNVNQIILVSLSIMIVICFVLALGELP